MPYAILASTPGTLDPFPPLRRGGGTAYERCSEEGWGVLQGWRTRGGRLKKVHLEGLGCVYVCVRTRACPGAGGKKRLGETGD